MKMDKNGNYPYKNMLDAMMKTVTKEGPLKLWVGFPTFYVRIAPHVMSHLLILDYFNNLYDKYHHWGWVDGNLLSWIYVLFLSIIY